MAPRLFLPRLVDLALVTLVRAFSAVSADVDRPTRAVDHLGPVLAAVVVAVSPAQYRQVGCGVGEPEKKGMSVRPYVLLTRHSIAACEVARSQCSLTRRSIPA